MASKGATDMMTLLFNDGVRLSPEKTRDYYHRLYAFVEKPVKNQESPIHSSRFPHGFDIKTEYYSGAAKVLDFLEEDGILISAVKTRHYFNTLCQV